MKTSAASGARIPQKPTAPAGDESAERDHRQRRREEDRDLPDPQQLPEVAGPGEDEDRAGENDEVDQRRVADRRSEREVERAPQRGDRQDEDRDQDEERLAVAQVLVVTWIGADRGDSADRSLGLRRDATGSLHSSDSTRLGWLRSARSRADNPVIVVG